MQRTDVTFTSDGRVADRRVLVKATVAGVRDGLRRLTGRPPLMMAAVGPPGSLAAMTTPDAEPGFRAIVPKSSLWRNEVAARIMLHVGSYRPGRAARRLQCPLLVCVADEDAVTPPGPAVHAAESAPHGELRRYPIGHFDVYVGEPFERAVSDQAEFLVRHLLGVGAPEAVAPGGAHA